MMPRQSYLVYRSPAGGIETERIRAATRSIEWVRLDEGSIPSMFRGQPNLVRRFENFRRRGAVGFASCIEGQWAGYGWMSHDSASMPPHLPRKLGREGLLWIFSCHTRTAYRGRGLYKNLMQHLRLVAATEFPTADELFIDTSPENVPSRRAIVASGFQEQGVVTVWYLRFPRLCLPIRSSWETAVPHLEIQSPAGAVR